MAKLDILTIPDPILRRQSVQVETVDETVRSFLDQMLEAMYEAPGIGLAAPQVGLLRRMVTIDVSKDEERPDPLFLINPEIVWRSEERSLREEGCLSIPDFFAEIERPARCRVRYVDRNGLPREIEADGLLATCIQHEVDHLDGLLFIDYLSRLKRDRVIRKFSKAAKSESKDEPARTANRL